MFGFSVFLNDEIDEDYLQRMLAAGFSGIFTSIHIPEEDASHYKQGLAQLGTFARNHHLELMVDISRDALGKLGASSQNISPLVDLGVTGLRIDYGLDWRDVAEISHQLKVALNASTLQQSDIDALKSFQADFTAIEAWHNYYPRPETGLDTDYLLARNQWLRTNHLPVTAFVAGDNDKRGPLYKGLPTLEEQRDLLPLAGALALIQDYRCDHVYIGDPGLSPSSCDQFATYINENSISLSAHALVAGHTDWLDHIEKPHSNRLDPARDVVRSQEARLRPLAKPIAALNTIERPIGAITIDNQAYQRYQGEVQIVKRALAADDKVNVVGQVIPSHLPLIKQIGPGQKFEIRMEAFD